MMLYGKYSLEPHEGADHGRRGAPLEALSAQQRTPGAADVAANFAVPRRRRALACGSPSGIDI